VRPRRSSGVVVRPLNFTVRSHLGEIQRREELGGCFGWLCGMRTVADSVVLRASSFDATDLRVRLLGVLNSGGKLASVAAALPHAHSGVL
jgi:hypothetical protein